MEPNGILHLDFKKNSSGKTYYYVALLEQQ